MLGQYLGSGASITKLLLHLNGNSNDSSGNGNNGTDSNITYSQANGRFGQGAGFNRASNSKIVCGTSSTLQPATALTFSLWIKITDVSSYNGIGGNTNSGTAYGYVWQVDSSNNTLKFFVGNGSWSNVSVTIPSTMVWHNIIGTWDGTNIKGYLDGNFFATTAKNAISYTNCGFTLGNFHNNNTTAQFFNGAMEECILENVAWTPQQVAKYYTMTKGRFGII